MAYTDLAMIAQAVITEKYGSVQNYSKEILNGSTNLFDQWAQGEAELNKQQVRQIKVLFTDYEWMLCQKATFQARTLPEYQGKAANLYSKAKKNIAQNWLKADNCRSTFKQEQVLNHPVIHLRLAMEYDLWGFEDMLDFIVPAQVQDEIQTKQLDLLTWANNLKIEG